MSDDNDQPSHRQHAPAAAAPPIDENDNGYYEDMLRVSFKNIVKAFQPVIGQLNSLRAELAEVRTLLRPPTAAERPNYIVIELWHALTNSAGVSMHLRRGDLELLWTIARRFVQEKPSETGIALASIQQPYDYFTEVDVSVCAGCTPSRAVKSSDVCNSCLDNIARLQKVVGIMCKSYDVQLTPEEEQSMWTSAIYLRDNAGPMCVRLLPESQSTQ